MEHDLQALQQRVVHHLKPSYQTSLKRGRERLAAYAATYDQAVDLLAKVMKVSKEKTKFESRHLLQQIMNEITG